MREQRLESVLERELEELTASSWPEPLEWSTSRLDLDEIAALGAALEQDCGRDRDEIAGALFMPARGDEIPPATEISGYLSLSSDPVHLHPS